METSIDEGLETEGEADEDPGQAFEAFQATRSGQRRHTLSEVTNQLVVMPGAGMILEKHQAKLLQRHVILQASRSGGLLTSFWNFIHIPAFMGHSGLGALGSYRDENV